MDDSARAEQGMAVRREVLGDAHVDRAVAGTTPVTAAFQDLITRYAPAYPRPTGRSPSPPGSSPRLAGQADGASPAHYRPASAGR